MGLTTSAPCSLTSYTHKDVVAHILICRYTHEGDRDNPKKTTINLSLGHNELTGIVTVKPWNSVVISDVSQEVSELEHNSAQMFLAF